MLARAVKPNGYGLHDVAKQLFVWVFTKNCKFSTKGKLFRFDESHNNFLKRRQNFKHIYDDKYINWKDVKLEPICKNFYTPQPSVLNRSLEEIQTFLSENDISIKGDGCPAPIFTFEEIGLPKNLENLLKTLNYKNPTPIQSQGWPIALSGRDMVGIGQTGSGKTLGFILPGLLNIQHQPPFKKGDGPILLVLAPTRELVQQIQKVSYPLAKSLQLQSVCVFGGSNRLSQLKSLYNGAEICIATPGRLLDFLKDDATNLMRCTYVVLDEADRMLDMGFMPQIEAILKQTRPDRQILMWSATWPKEIQHLAHEFLKNYIIMKVGSAQLMANPNIKQIIKICKTFDKKNMLKEILSEINQNKDNKTIIFVSTKHMSEEIFFYLKSIRLRCGLLHGGKSQNQRDTALTSFRSGAIQYLVATDVAARGLDVSDIRNVINFDCPNNIEDYVHRIGRTARYNASGTSYTFLTKENLKIIPQLLKILKDANQEVDPELKKFYFNSQDLDFKRNYL